MGLVALTFTSDHLKIANDKDYYFSKLITKTDRSRNYVETLLFSLVGKKILYLTDIYFRWDEKQRQTLQRTLEESSDTTDRDKQDTLAEFELTDDDLYFFNKLRTKEVFLKDMFSLVYLLESTLHEKLYQKMKDVHGNDWWREGVPQTTRESCSLRFERDNETFETYNDEAKAPPFDRYCYTNFIDLFNIMKHNSRHNDFNDFLPSGLNEMGSLKRRFNKLNTIRNIVMHPIKPYKYKEHMFLEFKDVLEQLQIR